MTDLRATAPNPPYRQVTIDCVQESCLTAIHQQLQMATGKTLPQFDRLHLSRNAATLAGVTPDALMGADHYLEAAKRFGVCPIGTPEADQDRVALDYRITEWTQYPTGWLQEYTGIVDAALAKDEPVVIAFGINTYAVNNPDWTLALMSPTDGAHSVCLLRGRNALPYDFENTWGPGWGRGGWGTIARDMLIKWRSGTSGIYSCRAARPASVPGEKDMTPAETQAMIDASLAPIKAQLAALSTTPPPVVTPPVVTPPTSTGGEIGRDVTGPGGDRFFIDGRAIRHDKPSGQVTLGFAADRLWSDGVTLKAQVFRPWQTDGPWYLYPSWTPTSAPT